MIFTSASTPSPASTSLSTPYLSAAVDSYLTANIDLAVRLSCAWVEVHTGYHFSSNIPDRRAAALERLKRTVSYAERAGMQLLIENLNFEPDDAEVHYLAHNVEECRYFFDAIDSHSLRWAFTVNHAHLVPEGIDGFLDEFGVGRMAEARLADSLGDKELHLLPGQGNIDFSALFKRMESMGFQGPLHDGPGQPSGETGGARLLRQRVRGIGCERRALGWRRFEGSVRRPRPSRSAAAPFDSMARGAYFADAVR